MQPDENQEEEKEKSTTSTCQGYKKKTLTMAVRTCKQKLLKQCRPNSPNKLDLGENDISQE
eukprot:4359455-Ditylum_brightwellii.AAC.1